MKISGSEQIHRGQICFTCSGLMNIRWTEISSVRTQELTIIMACRSDISCTPALHKMITVPVASRPRRPALPAIWMYSPESAAHERLTDLKHEDENRWKRASNLAAGFWSRCRRASWCCRTPPSSPACSPPSRTSRWRKAPERAGRSACGSRLVAETIQELTLTRPREKSISMTSFRMGRMPLWWTATPLFRRSRISRIWTRNRRSISEFYYMSKYMNSVCIGSNKQEGIWILTSLFCW